MGILGFLGRIAFMAVLALAVEGMNAASGGDWYLASVAHLVQAEGGSAPIMGPAPSGSSGSMQSAPPSGGGTMQSGGGMMQPPGGFSSGGNQQFGSQSGGGSFGGGQMMGPPPGGMHTPQFGPPRPGGMQNPFGGSSQGSSHGMGGQPTNNSSHPFGGSGSAPHGMMGGTGGNSMNQHPGNMQGQMQNGAGSGGGPSSPHGMNAGGSQGFMMGEENENDEEVGNADAEEAARTAQEIRTLLQQIKNITRQAGRGAGAEVGKLKELASQLSKLFTVLTSDSANDEEVSAALNAYDEGDFREQVRTLSMAIETRRMIAQFSSDTKKLIKALDAKAAAKLGLDIARARAIALEMQAALAKADELLKSDDSEGARDALEIFETQRPGDILQTVLGVRELQNMRKRTRDTALQSVIDVLITKVTALFNAGSYADARAALEEGRRNLQGQ